MRKLISLGVLDSNGKGSTSNVIAAIDWVIANKSTYNIRVINMSLGTPPKDSYKTDPLCLAARRAYNAGIVVVASAGNFGKDIYGNKLYGGINSPGIEPSVITVGAVNTYGTDNRYDDTVATFSSRGPTRGYTTVNGVRKYDNLIKPDIVAPGNRLIAACSPSSVSKIFEFDHPGSIAQRRWHRKRQIDVSLRHIDGGTTCNRGGCDVAWRHDRILLRHWSKQS